MDDVSLENLIEEMVEACDRLGRRVSAVAEAITAPASPGQDEAGNTVMSLTEAVMGITAGLFAISESIQHLAEAIKDD